LTDPSKPAQRGSSNASFVERAAEHLDSSQAQPADGASGLSRARFRDGSLEAPSDPGVRGVDEAAAALGRDKRRPPDRAPRVELDFGRMKAAGLLTPETMRSHLSEEVRLLKQDVVGNFHEAAVPRSNLIMVTSPNPGEGKTFTTLNLAISLACDPDFNVLLVDADFANPQIAKYLGLSPSGGLLDVLADETKDLSEVILRTSIEHLGLIAAGHAHDMSVELLGSKRMLALAQELADRYPDRLVLFDTPPLLASVDPTVLAKRMGQVLLVVEAERTNKQDIQQSLDLLPSEAYLGLVLNKGSGLGASTYSHYGYYRQP